MKNAGGVFLIYGGDINQDGFVGVSDMLGIDNQSALFGSGYLAEDANGDGFFSSGEMGLAAVNAVLGEALGHLALTPGSGGFRLDWPGASMAYITDTTADPNADYVKIIAGVLVLLGAGDGSFRVIGTPEGVSCHDQLLLQDVNGDHKPDLIVTDWTKDRISVLLGNGDGTFQPAHRGVVEFGYNQYWRVNKHLRLVGDVETVGLPVSLHLEVEATAFDMALCQCHFCAVLNRPYP